MARGEEEVGAGAGESRINELWSVLVHGWYFFKIKHKMINLKEPKNPYDTLNGKSIFLHFSEKSYNKTVYGYQNIKAMKMQNCKISNLHHSNVK